jgi:hypothetical protein
MHSIQLVPHVHQVFFFKRFVACLQKLVDDHAPCKDEGSWENGPAGAVLTEFFNAQASQYHKPSLAPVKKTKRRQLRPCHDHCTNKKKPFKRPCNAKKNTADEHSALQIQITR